MMKKSFGFTLGEILIALSVIGVVASLVIPQLVNGHKAGEAQAQFNTAYSLIAKAITDMDADNISIKPASYSAGQALYPKFKQYSRVAIDCGDYTAESKNASVCINQSAQSANDEKDNYYAYSKASNTKANISRFDDGAFVLNNGMLVAFENPANGYVWISVDINGKNKMPNRWGWDLFTFELTNDGLLPLGAPGTTATYSADPNVYCNIDQNTSNENGATCSYFAITNQDYFKELYKGH